MKKGLLWFGFGLAGFAVALGLSIGAYAITGSEFRSPARPLVYSQQEISRPSAQATPKHKHHRQKHHPRPTHSPPPPPSSAPTVPSSPAPHPSGGGTNDHHPSGDD